jgi:hypothetical protein
MAILKAISRTPWALVRERATLEAHYLQQA